MKITTVFTSFFAVVAFQLLGIVTTEVAPALRGDERELQTTYYISTCGMELKSVLSLPQFFVYAVPALVQAFFAPGNVRAWYLPFADFKLTSHRTLSAWKTEEDLLNFVRGGSHARAVKIIPQIATEARALRYTSTDIPNFSEVLPRWEEEAVVVFGDGMVNRHF